MARTKRLLLRTDLKLVRTGLSGHSVAGVWISSACVFSADTSAQ